MGELRVENGTTRFIGGTSHLIHWDAPGSPSNEQEAIDVEGVDVDPITSWSNVNKDPEVVTHLLNMYFNWHYPYFTTLSRSLFYRDFFRGKQNVASHKTAYCSSLLVSHVGPSVATSQMSPQLTELEGTAGPREITSLARQRRLIVDHDEYEKPRLTTVQALALMSVREAGCGREAKGWVYSGMSFRMAQDLGLNMNLGGINGDLEHLDEKEVDARSVTFWGCFLFDKCWSNYMAGYPSSPKTPTAFRSMMFSRKRTPKAGAPTRTRGLMKAPNSQRELAQSDFSCLRCVKSAATSYSSSITLAI